MSESFLKPTTREQLQARLHWVLRITAACCFIGHGAWGVITKEGWLPFFRSQGIPDDIAWKLMPIIGALDIIMGILLLIKPRRIIIMWMLIWALWTAILRPISGTPGTWEFWERAGNFLPPLMLLILGGAIAMKWKDWFSGYTEPKLDNDKIGVLHFICRLTMALLLIGHGGFGAFVEKGMLINHFSSIGIPADVGFVNAVGWFEIILGVVVFASHTAHHMVRFRLESDNRIPICHGRWHHQYIRIHRTLGRLWSAYRTDSDNKLSSETVSR